MPKNTDRWTIAWLKAAIRDKREHLAQRAIVKASALFDKKWYLLQNPDVATSGVNPLNHYLYVGWNEWRNPHPLFETEWYLATNPDVAAAGTNPLIHYLRFGWAENRWPHPLFDSVFYRSQQNVKEPLSHYVLFGSAKGLKPNALFDPAWYRRRYAEPSEPLFHFYRSGSRAGCKPIPLFDPAWYLERSPDVVSGGAEALSHYLHFGWKEQRSPSPLFDPIWYLAQYPDVEAKGIDPLQHYLQSGSAENRMPNALFQPEWYRHQHIKNDGICMEPLSHYVEQGEAQGLGPIPHFEPAWYREANKDVQESGLGPFSHYLLFGKGERRAATSNWKAYRNIRRKEVLGSSRARDTGQRVAVGIVAFNNEAAQLDRCIRSAGSAFVFVIDNGDPSTVPSHVTKLPTQGNIGFGSAHNILMTAAFQRGAAYYIAANPDGTFDPSAIEALLQMQQACGGDALIEALQFPEEHPKIYADDDFETPWASGACLMIPQVLYEKIGGFDESLFMYCEDVDLSWRAKSAGFAVKTCPRALFYHPVNSQAPDPDTTERYLRSGVVLARKWGSKSFESEMLAELERRGMNREDIPQPPRFRGPRGYADFSHGFSFAPVRW